MISQETLSLALVSFDPADDRPDTCLDRVDDIIYALMAETSAPIDIIVFPEAFCTADDYSFLAAANTDSIISRMLSNANLTSCAIVGSVIVPVRDKLYNRFVFAKPDGSVDVYDKRHPYFGAEEEIISPGGERKIIEWRGWRIMPAVCMDLRFPCWARNFSDLNYDLYLNVANWPVARKAAAETLMKARAIENSAYAAFCNRAGRDQWQEYDGNSLIVNYRGRNRAVTRTVCGTQVSFATLQKDELQRFRANMPLLERVDNFEFLRKN